MSRRFTAGLGVCGSLVLCVFSSPSDPKEQPRAVTHLIESIQGPPLYKAYCAVCHGTDGKGGGPMSNSLKVKPLDLTHIAARNRGAFPLARVEKIIASEEPIPAGHGTREMPVWGPIFSQIAWDQDLGQIRIYNLAKYIQGIQAK
jgi:mono/diheme cytochrome c family protein